MFFDVERRKVFANGLSIKAAEINETGELLLRSDVVNTGYMGLRVNLLSSADRSNEGGAAIAVEAAQSKTGTNPTARIQLKNSFMTF